MVWDTGSDWLVIESVECDTCIPPVYDYTLNPSTYSKQYGSESSRNYGSTSTKGYLANDRICLSASSKADLTDKRQACVDGFRFFMITWQEGMNDIDGILGMTSDYENGGPLFIKSLKD